MDTRWALKKRLQKSLYSHELETYCTTPRRVREEKGLTQLKLAESFGRQRNLSAKIEAGKQKLDACQVLDYLDSMEVDPPEGEGVSNCLNSQE